MNEDRQAIVDVGEVVGRMFLRPTTKPPQPKRHRHRCFQCGKVTKYIFCPECHKARCEDR